MKKYIIVILFITSVLSVKAQEERFYYNDSDYMSCQKKGTGSIKLVFIHGFGASNNSWDDIQVLFDSTEYTSYLLDLKGFGKSSIPKDNKYSMRDHEKIISKFINSDITDDYYLIGHSYGGGVSLLLTISEQLKIKPKSLILIDCAAYHSETPFFIKYLQIPVVNRMMFFFSTPKMRARFTLKRIVIKEHFSEEMLSRHTKSLKGKRKKYSYIKTAKQIIPDNYEQLTNGIKEIEIPTLIIWGKQDKVLPVEHGELLFEQIKNSKLEILEECGHIPHEEYPVETFKIIEKFLNNLKK